MTLGAVETFIPITPTVFIRIESASARMRALHEKLNTEVLRFQEEWPYIPHLTDREDGFGEAGTERL